MKKIHLSTYLTERWLNCVVVTLKNKHTLLQIYVRFLFLPFEFVFLMHTILLKLLLINAKRDLLLEPFFLFFCHTTRMQFEAKLFTFFLCYLFKQLFVQMWNMQKRKQCYFCDVYQILLSLMLNFIEFDIFHRVPSYS